MSKTEKCCGTCKFHKCYGDGEWICENPESDNNTDYTNYQDTCCDWEGRNNE